MKLSLNWIKDYVDLPQELSPEQIAHDLTMCTVEVEHVERIGARFENVVIGRVDEVLPHPSADRLRIAKTDIGAASPATIVCGGSNLKAGMLTAVALPGAMVRWHGQGDLVKLEPAKVRGVKSEGMICAGSELNLEELFPCKEESEILDLSGVCAGAAAGTPLASALGIEDVVLEIDNKSLTNRPDLWGHYGIARELSAIYKRELKPLNIQTLPAANDKLLQVKISDPRCSRYIGVLLEAPGDAQSPEWLKRRLTLIGQRPISFLVDLTNYVMFAAGQPTHVFDYDKLAGRSIDVRAARQAEKILLLDGKEYELPGKELVIADAEAAVALAGVMGGGPSSVTAETRRIVLECACFDAMTIRRSSSKLGLRSESSIRFEKGIDSERGMGAVSLFLSTLCAVLPEARIVCAVDCYPSKPETKRVEVSLSYLTSRIGEEFSADYIREILQRLGFGVEFRSSTFLLTVPAWRATGDVSIPEDIVEEVARLHGYDNVKFSAPPVMLTGMPRLAGFQLKRTIREYLAFSAGMNEVFTYPWVEDKLLSAAGIDTARCLKLFAPPAPSLSCVQTSLLPAMFGVLEKNARLFEDLRIFQLAQVFYADAVSPVSGPGEKLPLQPVHAAALVAGPDAAEVYFTVKGAVEGLLFSLGLPALEVSVNTGLSWAANGSGTTLACGGKIIGELGLLSPLALEALGLSRDFVGAFELDVAALESIAKAASRFEPLPEFPVVWIDIAMVFDSAVSWEEIRKEARGAHRFVTGVRFVDEYRGKQVPAGKKSVALRIELYDKQATLTSEQIAEASQKVIDTLRTRFGGELR